MGQGNFEGNPLAIARKELGKTGELLRNINEEIKRTKDPVSLVRLNEQLAAAQTKERELDAAIQQPEREDG